MRVLHAEKKMKLSGQGLRVLRVLRELQARGHSVAVACQPESALAEVATSEGMAVCALPMNGARLYAGVPRLRRFIRQHGFQVVHAHGARDHVMCALASVGLRRVALVRTKHNMAPLKNGVFARLLYGRRTSRLVAVSEAVRDVLLAGGLPGGRIDVIYSGIETARFTPRAKDPAALEAWGLSPEHLVVGLVARLSSKSVDTRTLMVAFQHLGGTYPQARLLLVGRWSDRVLRWADELGIQDRVILPGFTEDVPAALSVMDVFVQPNVAAGMGSALIEAMAMARPIVATRVGGIPEAVVEGETGSLCPPGDPEAMAEALAGVLTLSPQARAAMGQRAHERAERLFTVERMVDQIEALYERVAGAGP